MLCPGRFSSPPLFLLFETPAGTEWAKRCAHTRTYTLARSHSGRRGPGVNKGEGGSRWPAVESEAAARDRGSEGTAAAAGSVAGTVGAFPYTAVSGAPASQAAWLWTLLQLSPRPVEPHSKPL